MGWLAPMQFSCRGGCLKLVCLCRRSLTSKAEAELCAASLLLQSGGCRCNSCWYGRCCCCWLLLALGQSLHSWLLAPTPPLFASHLLAQGYHQMIVENAAKKFGRGH